MHLEMIYVNYGAEAGADKYLELVKKAVATGKTLVLGCDDVEVAKAALEIAKAGKPILNGANASNYEAMNALAKEADVVLGVSGANPVSYTHLLLPFLLRMRSFPGCQHIRRSSRKGSDHVRVQRCLHSRQTWVLWLPRM